MVEFTKEEIGVIKERMSKITTHIPNNQAKCDRDWETI